MELPNYTNPMFWVDFSLTLLVLVGLAFVTVLTLKRKLPLILISVGAVLILVGKLLGLGTLTLVAACATFTSLIVCLMVNVAVVRPMITNPVATKAVGKGNKAQVTKVYDRYELCSKVATAVTELSRKKIGALITFEKEDSLENLVNTTGTILNAPVVPELLLSIFYEGTRLHDGAVIIRRDMIYSAAAFFPSTEKALAGKFGSRHRAAIGISEISDSVTVVVSEETGRISFAIDGELIHTTADTFERELQDYLITDNK